MGKFKLKRALGENGLSLVEVLASFVILTLLLTTFLMMFVQSAKVNKASEHVIDATYIAQTEMERLYEVSKSLSEKPSFANKVSGIKDLGYPEPSSPVDWIKFERETDSTYGFIRVKLENNGDGKMTRIIVEVYENPDGILRAKMENVLVWGTD